MSLAPGTRLGPYEIQSAIGAGGMGEVHKLSGWRPQRRGGSNLRSPAHEASPCSASFGWQAMRRWTSTPTQVAPASLMASVRLARLLIPARRVLDAHLLVIGNVAVHLSPPPRSHVIAVVCPGSGAYTGPIGNAGARPFLLHSTLTVFVWSCFNRPDCPCWP